MRPLDTRLWNLVPAALLLTSACQTAPEVPVDETETGTGDDANPDPTMDPIGDGDGDGDGDPTTGPEPTGDDDGDGDPTDGGPCNPPCGAHELCIYGGCYSYPDDPECHNDLDCGAGEWCDDECMPLPPLGDCADAPELVEIPLPAAAQGLTLDLQFVDLDGDGIDELVLLKPGELLVVDSDQSVASYPVDAMSEEFAAVRANDDAHLDLVVTSWSPEHAGLLLGNGDATLAAATSLPLPALMQPQAVDWMPGGAHELVALDFDTHSTQLVTDLAGAASYQSFPVLGFINEDLDAIHVVDVDSDDEPEVLLRRNCSVSYQGFGGEITDIDTWNGDGCRSYYEPLGPFGEEVLVLLANVGIDTGIRTFSGYANYEQDATISGTVDDLAGVAGLGLVLAGPTGTRLLEPGEPTIDCIASLDGLPIATRVITGEFAQNPGEEFLLLGQNQLSVWARP